MPAFDVRETEDVLYELLIERARATLNAHRQEYEIEFFSGKSWGQIKPKPTLLEKVKLMWERQPYFKTLPSKAYIKAKEVKPKPYWRMDERW